jgi:integrase
MYRKRKSEQEADVEGNKIKRSNALVKQYLSEAQRNLNQKEPFYVALEKALHNFLKAKLRLETSEMSKETIRNLMKEKEADAITVAEFIKLIENCEFARYAPSSAAAIQTDFDTAVRLLTELEKQMV